MTNLNIYEYFNSRDIAEHCRNIGHPFTAIETAYTLRVSDAEVVVEATTSPGRKYILSVHDFEKVVSWSSTPIRRIARYMRIRPEAVFQILSAAFDESIKNHTLTIENGCLRFEADIATVTLVPGDSGLPPWELKYRAKEAMIEKNIAAHPKDSFSIPTTLFNGDVLFPDVQMHALMELAASEETLLPEMCLDALNQAYCKALNEGSLMHEEGALTFKTTFRTRSGMNVYAKIEPDFYAPIPNTWKLTHIHCLEKPETVEENSLNIYDYFNSRDIAEHCRNIGHPFTAIETAYLVWHSNHHTLADKHKAWQKIIGTMPDEPFHPNWDFDGHTLHSFLRTYMRLQNTFIADFCTTKEGYIYTYSALCKRQDQFCPGRIFFDSYDTCLNALKVNELEEDTYGEIVKAKITRHRVYSSHVSFRDAQGQESVVFDKQLQPIEIEPACESESEKRYISPSYGFDEMWVAIPTPFRKGDIVMDVDVYDDCCEKHLPFVLERIPYWRRNAENGDDCEKEVERLLESGVDWTDMQEGVFFQDSNGEIYWDHAFNYLNLEYYRDELKGPEKLLIAVSSVMQGKITIEDFIRSHSITLMENHISETRRHFGINTELLRLCGLADKTPL